MSIAAKNLLLPCRDEYRKNLLLLCRRSCGIQNNLLNFTPMTVLNGNRRGTGRTFIDRIGPAGLTFSTGPDRPVEILDLTGKKTGENRQRPVKNGRFKYRIEPAKNRSV
jgi:hypothetical protein